MQNVDTLTLDPPNPEHILSCTSAAQMCAHGFGIIGFDSATVVGIYNQFEPEFADLSRARHRPSSVYTCRTVHEQLHGRPALRGCDSRRLRA